MLKPRLLNLAFTMLAGLAICTNGCTDRAARQLTEQVTAERLTTEPTLTHPQTQPSAAAPSTSPQKAAASKSDSFQLAIEHAASADRIGQSAESRDDWQLVVDRWQQAIALMKTVPTSSPNRTKVQQKLAQYQQKLAYAQRQANRPTTPINPNGVVVLPSGTRSPQSLHPSIPPSIPRSVSPIVAAAPQAAPQPEDSQRAAQGRRFYAPIVRREGNTPVIRVVFNNKQIFDMIVDTGASGTLITRQMANKLGVLPVSQANVDTASQRNVTVPLGYVQSIAVDGVVATNLLVAVAGPELETGLLGHDFFGHYDVTIRETEVEFQER